MVEPFSRALVRLQEQDRLLDRLADEFMGGQSSCMQASAGEEQIRFMQVAGLWIILAGTAALAFLGMLLAYVWLGCRARRRRRGQFSGAAAPFGICGGCKAGSLHDAAPMGQHLSPPQSHMAALDVKSGSE